MRHLRFGPVVVDMAALCVTRPDSQVRLTPTEQKLLSYLLSLDGRVCDRQELLREVWGYRSLNSRTLATTISRLRRKIEPDPDEPAYLLTQHRAGYRLVPPDDTPNAVPAPLGREAEVAETLQALSEQHWVTLVGPGGSGKSTVARAVASQMGATRIPFVSPLPRAVSEAMGWPLSEATPQSVASLLRRAGALTLWIDDADGGIEELARIGGRWLEHCPELRVLATSCRAIRVEGEATVSVLGLPPSASLELLGAGPEETLLTIAEALEHLPLALVLVGSWIPLLGLEAVLEQVIEGTTFQALGSEADPRHQTLNHLIAPALESLDDAPRSTLRALCAFTGPVTLPQLRELVPDAAKHLIRLVDHHLVRRDGQHFMATAAVRRHVRRHHARDFDDALARVLSVLGQPDALEHAGPRGDPAWVKRIRLARPELPAAVRSSLAVGEVQRAASCALAFAISSTWDGGRDQALALLDELPQTHTDLQARIDRVRIRLLLDAGEAVKARQQIPDSPGDDLQMLLLRASADRALGDADGARATLREVHAAATPESEVRALAATYLADLASVRGDPTAAESFIREASRLFEARGDRRHQVRVWARSAIIEHQLGRDWHSTLETARSLAIALQSGTAEARVASAEALLSARDGDPEAAFDAYTEAAARYRESGVTNHAIRTELAAAAVGLQLDMLDDAWELASRVLPTVRARGDQAAEVQALYVLGEVSLARGDTEKARAYLEPALERALDPEVVAQLEKRLGRL